MNESISRKFVINKFIHVLIIVLIVSLQGFGAEKLPLPDMIPHLSILRQAGIGSPEEAFAYYTDPAGVIKLRELGKILCPDIDQTKGWQYFLGTSIATVSSLNEETVLSMLYNPWSDVALLCQWKNFNGIPKITDADLVVGDILRNTREPELSPLWRRVGEVPAPLAITVATSDTVKGFMGIYGKRAMFNSENWRGRLKGLKKDHQVAGNRQAVGFMFTQAMTGVNLFFTDESFKPLKSSMEKIRNLLLKGRTDEVLKIASETGEESKAILTEVPFEWKKASMVSIATDPKNSFIFLADYSNPEYFACFWFTMSQDSKAATLKRIDFLGHNISFEQANALANQAGMKR